MFADQDMPGIFAVKLKTEQQLPVQRKSTP